MTIADLAYSIDNICDEDCDLPMDLQTVMRAWPYLITGVRGRIVTEVIAGVREHFDIDSAPDAEPQPAADESALAAFEAERRALADGPDTPF
jgi:hypothetical protein